MTFQGETDMKNKNILVLGIGNILLTDEGVGIRVIERSRAAASIGEAKNPASLGLLVYCCSLAFDLSNRVISIVSPMRTYPARSWTRTACSVGRP